MGEHVCDRKGPSAKVVDESGDEPITRIYPTCSVCGKPQGLTEADRVVGQTNRINVLRLRYKAAFDAHRTIAMRNADLVERGIALSDQQREDEKRAAAELIKASDEMRKSRV